MIRPRLRVYQSGVTLVELMIAMVLGLLVSGGIITVFLTTSNSNRVQNQLARLQEEGRYAIGRLVGRRPMALKFAQRCVANAAGRHVAVLMRRSSRKFSPPRPKRQKNRRRRVAWYRPLN